MQAVGSAEAGAIRQDGCVPWVDAPRSRFGTEGILLECGVRPIGRDAIVLVVEDDAELRNLYRAALRSAGYAVFAVDDGIDALEYVEQTMPAAIVLDLGLPRLDGRDVQRELAAQRHTERIPIVVVTGQTEGIDEGDFACVLRKPVEPEALVGAVQNCLDQWK